MSEEVPTPIPIFGVTGLEVGQIIPLDGRVILWDGDSRIAIYMEDLEAWLTALRHLIQP